MSKTQEYSTYVETTTHAGQTYEDRLVLGALGLSGEVGEVADIIKKNLFHDHPMDVDKLLKEMGDVLWYLTLLANTFNCSLDELMDKNMVKLKERYPNGFDPERSRNREEKD